MCVGSRAPNWRLFSLRSNVLIFFLSCLINQLEMVIRVCRSFLQLQVMFVFCSSQIQFVILHDKLMQQPREDWITWYFGFWAWKQALLTDYHNSCLLIFLLSLFSPPNLVDLTHMLEFSYHTRLLSHVNKSIFPTNALSSKSLRFISHTFLGPFQIQNRSFRFMYTH